MKQPFRFLALTAVAFLIALFITGQQTVRDAYITDYSLSADGQTMQFSVSVASSIGYVRDYKDRPDKDGNHYLTFYSAWGGYNSPLGSNNFYTLPLSPADQAIYVKGNDGYRLALAKNAQGIWEYAKE